MNIFFDPKKKTNSVALSPRANYTDWSTALSTKFSANFFGYKGVVNLSFLGRLASYKEDKFTQGVIKEYVSLTCFLLPIGYYLLLMLLVWICTEEL
jgi:hypothetical protein